MFAAMDAGGNGELDAQDFIRNVRPQDAEEILRWHHQRQGIAVAKPADATEWLAQAQFNRPAAAAAAATGTDGYLVGPGNYVPYGVTSPVAGPEREAPSAAADDGATGSPANHWQTGGIPHDGSLDPHAWVVRGTPFPLDKRDLRDGHALGREEEGEEAEAGWVVKVLISVPLCSLWLVAWQASSCVFL